MGSKDSAKRIPANLSASMKRKGEPGLDVGSEVAFIGGVMSRGTNATTRIQVRLDGRFRSRYLEQLDEHIDEERAIGERRSNTGRGAAGHLDAEVLSA